jgi:hypothetical protein
MQLHARIDSWLGRIQVVVHALVVAPTLANRLIAMTPIILVPLQT